jgi:hypothetical protein
MVMDWGRHCGAPLSGLLLATNTVQFLDLSSKVISKGCRIYRSVDGTLPKNIELEVVTNDMSRLAQRVRNKGLNSTTLSEEEKYLQTTSDSFSHITEELLRGLEKLKVKSDAKQRG